MTRAAHWAVDKWKSGGRARNDTLRVVTKGMHAGITDYRSAVNDARLAVGDACELQPSAAEVKRLTAEVRTLIA